MNPPDFPHTIFVPNSLPICDQSAHGELVEKCLCGNCWIGTMSLWRNCPYLLLDTSPGVTVIGTSARGPWYSTTVSPSAITALYSAKLIPESQPLPRVCPRKLYWAISVRRVKLVESLKWRACSREQHNFSQPLSALTSDQSSRISEIATGQWARSSKDIIGARVSSEHCFVVSREPEPTPVLGE